MQVRKNGTATSSKIINKKRVLQCIRENEAISRAEIAFKLSISKPTVSLLVDELIWEKWVIEHGSGASSSQGGRRPIQLHFNHTAAYVIGCDIGGTKVKIVLSDLSGRIVAKRDFKTEPYLASGLLKQMKKEITSMIDESSIRMEKILGMGVGIPGITDTESGLVIEAPSLNWIRYPFLQEAEKIFSFPVYVDNDVNSAALGEQWLGCAMDKRNVLFISIGTGIGSGIIIDNQLYRGSSSAAGEIGYMVTNKNSMNNNFKPVFHRYGFLESVAGGKAVGEHYTKAVQSMPEHPLYEQSIASVLDGEIVFKMAKAEDATALAVIDESNQHLAYGIINAASILNPEVIILGGGVLKSAGLIIPRLREIVNQYLPSSVEIRVSKLGENAGVLGAVSLFLHEHDSIFQFHNKGEIL